jgi:Protein of unknown function (DUF2817)
MQKLQFSPLLEQKTKKTETSKNGAIQPRQLALLAAAALTLLACFRVLQVFWPVPMSHRVQELNNKRQRQICGHKAGAPMVGTVDSLKFLLSNYVRPAVKMTGVKLLSATTSLCGIYSVTYDEARSRFRAAAKALQDKSQNQKLDVALHTLPIPPVSLGRTRDGAILQDDDLTIDIAVIRPPKGKTGGGYVIYTSGIHGVEGYAGSGVQVAFLQMLSQFGYEQVVGPENPLHPTIILIHAWNPFGMKYNRRFNERNIDMNRNGLLPSDLAQIGKDGTKHYNYLPYKDMDASLFNPPVKSKAVAGSALSYWALVNEYYAISIQYFAQSFWSITRYGFPKVKAAFVGAQYHNPTGISYGGNPDEPMEPSLKIVRDFVQREVSQRGRQGNGGVTWVDAHTGLGPKGVDTLLVTAGRTSVIWPERDMATELLTWYPNSISPLGPAAQTGADSKSKEAGKGVVQGYEAVSGLATEYFETLFTAANKPLLVMQEFGTVPTVVVGHALTAENYMYRKYVTSTTDVGSASASDFVNRWQYFTHRTTRAVFDPDDNDYRFGVVARGLRLLSQAIERSTVYSSPSATSGANSDNAGTATTASSVGDEL